MYGGFFGPNITDPNVAFLESSGPSIKFTGSDDEKKTGQWKQYYGLTNLSGPNAFSGPCLYENPRAAYPLNCKLWNTSEVITGSYDGVSGVPLTEGSTPPNMPLYIADALRVVNFVYRNDVTYKGIALRNYTMDLNAMKSAAENPDNAKYYMTHDPSLIIPLNRYLGGVDVFLSFPHFLGAPSTVTSTFNSSLLQPDPAKHQSYLFAEPLTGLNMKAHKRLMAGVKLSPLRVAAYTRLTGAPLLDELDFYYKLWYNGADTVIYLPTFWAEEFGEISSDDAAKFSSAIYDNRKIGRGIQIAFVVFGGVSLVFLAFIYYRKAKSSSDTSV
jgi:hypothetical protein